MGKTFQAATTNTWKLFDPTSLLQNIFLISAKLNFHQPLVCSTVRDIQYYTPEVGGSSVWHMYIKKIFFRSHLWPKSTHVLVVAAWNVFPIHSLVSVWQFFKSPETEVKPIYLVRIVWKSSQKQHQVNLFSADTSRLEPLCAIVSTSIMYYSTLCSKAL